QSGARLSDIRHQRVEARMTGVARSLQHWRARAPHLRRSPRAPHRSACRAEVSEGQCATHGEPAALDEGNRTPGEKCLREPPCAPVKAPRPKRAGVRTSFLVANGDAPARL